ncbi:MAG: hypothetical protein ACK59M_11760 [Pseudomonadota bacterium]
MSNKLTNTLSLAVGATLLGAAGLVHAGTVFELTDLGAGYMLVGDEKAKEGKCGEGTCGAEKGKEGACGGDKHEAEGKCGEGKCGEGKCGGEKTEKGKEGKCGEGKCGGEKAEKGEEGKCGGAA